MLERVTHARGRQNSRIPERCSTILEKTRLEYDIISYYDTHNPNQVTRKELPTSQTEVGHWTS